MFWFQEGLCGLPAFLVVWSSSTFIVNYIIALYKGHVDVVFPYISDTGAIPPESCIFGLMSTITAFAGFATMFARYKFLERQNEITGGVSPALNKAALFFAVTSCLGMCVVATFQETTEGTVHDIGAFIFFLSGVVYIILQTIISHKAHPYGASKRVCYIRTIFAIVAFVAAFPTIIFAFLVKVTKLHWNPEDENYKFHLASAVSEWIVSFTFVFFFFTYIQEFKQFTLKVKAELLEFT
ncbi:DNA damage-regulated autophagy modulator protein 1 [Pygocentrus nattereri]|uniref:CWH43-like N-terminal domain-containing protein n=1 Tax=Pygocentrus nattereri TaxID=42514 RepID=A0A3B4E5H9_PYGNA|nr:DNA damage-regulated autophagy modulator protein 1 [Pygocentrus nattereri]XP_017571846.1 DNA damage-regulated autophagy modulator protein 1 [Pygocentrus nattereri]